MISPMAPRWSDEQLEAGRQAALARFREERIQEPLEAYLEAFDIYRAMVENLLEMTVDLSRLTDAAVAVLTDDGLLDAVRYLAAPPISEDDLEILAEASLSPNRLRQDADMAHRVIDTILLGLDRNRFPWVAEDREPTEAERDAAALASAALMASRRVMTDRANQAKTQQESAVKTRLAAAGLREVAPHEIPTLDAAPARGEFCGESMFAGRKADIVVRLWDGRAMPTECKVSNSYLNSVKRLNNDAAVKAAQWVRDFGSVQTVPAAILAGVYKLRHLVDAQRRGLTLFWAHDLEPMIAFIDATRAS